jgi:thiamine phosphate synthase YjbQ (UPF0047 family)
VVSHTVYRTFNTSQRREFIRNLLVHHQVIVPVTEGELDLGPWQQVFYCEFDGGRSKRLVIKVLGE